MPELPIKMNLPDVDDCENLYADGAHADPSDRSDPDWRDNNATEAMVEAGVRKFEELMARTLPRRLNPSPLSSPFIDPDRSEFEPFDPRNRRHLIIAVAQMYSEMRRKRPKENFVKEIPEPL